MVKARQVLLTLGGTGLIGTALANAAERAGHDCLSLSLSDDQTNASGYRNIFCDLSKISAQDLDRLLRSALARRPRAPSR